MGVRVSASKFGGAGVSDFLLQAMGTTPVGPLSPLFLDLRPTSIKKHPTLGTAHHPRRPGSWSLGGEWTNYIGLPK